MLPTADTQLVVAGCMEGFSATICPCLACAAYVELFISMQRQNYRLIKLRQKIVHHPL